MSETLKSSYKYVIVGGGVAAGYAVKGIRKVDPQGPILILSAESFPPFQRPALSKGFWVNPDLAPSDTKTGVEDESQVTLKLNTPVKAVYPKQKKVEIAGQRIAYDRLLLVPGTVAKNPLKGPEDDLVFNLKTLKDYQKLKRLSEKKKHVLLVGGGYIGTELASALSQYQTPNTLIYPQAILGEDLFPKPIAQQNQKLFTDHGVNLVSGRRAVSYRRAGKQLVLKLDNGKELSGDGIVVSLGSKPNLKLAKDSGLSLDNQGVVVDARFKTSAPDIWAAGDIASFPDVLLGQVHLEHVDHARNSGEVAGENMAGKKISYKHISYFYSLVFGFSWQALGKFGPDYQAIYDKRKGGTLVYFLQNSHLVGVLNWGLQVDLDDIRRLLKNPPAKENLVGSLKEKKA